MRHFKLLTTQVIVAAVCARLALLYFEISFTLGETGTTPLGWEIALDAIIGVIFLMGVGLGFAGRRFPWFVLLMIPPMIRAFMLRPLQQDLYSLALILGAYSDLLFLAGAAIGIVLFRWRRRRPAT